MEQFGFFFFNMTKESVVLLNLFPFDLESEDLPSSPKPCLGHQPKLNK